MDSLLLETRLFSPLGWALVTRLSQTPSQLVPCSWVGELPAIKMLLTLFPGTAWAGRALRAVVPGAAKAGNTTVKTALSTTVTTPDGASTFVFTRQVVNSLLCSGHLLNTEAMYGVCEI